MKLASTVLCLSAFEQSIAFAPARVGVLPSSKIHAPKLSVHAPRSTQLFASNSNDNEEANLRQFDFPQNEEIQNLNPNMMVPTLAVASLAFMPLSAEAATGTNQVASAFMAYGHYLSLFLMIGALMFERLTIAPGMTKETERSLVFADAAYGVSAVALLVSGYYRAVEYGKGWNFYSHEPIFWVKMVFFSILGSASLFPTITSIKRAILATKGGDSWQPMTDKLADRMKSVVNAELLIMGSIPLSATLMSRGIGYSETIPYNIIGPVLTAATALGLGFKYTKEAITWSEDE
jgi:putative membrane protein